MTAGRIVFMDESYLWTPEAPCPFTQEQLMSQDQSVRPHAGSLAPTAPSPAQPGTTSALDNLDYQRSELNAAIAGLISRISPILTDEEPADPMTDNGKMYGSAVARSIEDHAEQLRRLADGVRSVTRRVDV